MKDLGQFSGRALLIGISRDRATRAPASPSLRNASPSLGATCSLVTLQDTLAAQFGQFHFQTTDGGRR